MEFNVLTLKELEFDISNNDIARNKGTLRKLSKFRQTFSFVRLFRFVSIKYFNIFEFLCLSKCNSSRVQSKLVKEMVKVN